MAGVHIVTDSSCDLSAAQTDELGVRVVPLTIRFGSDEYTDRVDLSVEDFYATMASTEALPETAAPAPGAFEVAFREAAEAGADSVVCICISSLLSATSASAQNAARALEGEVDVRVVDSRSISSGLGSHVIAAVEAARGGADADAVVQLIESRRPGTRVIAALDTLENLKKGGRIGGAQAMLGSLLSVKPCIDISTGEVKEAGKPRTRKKSFEWLRDRLFAEEQVTDLAVTHGLAPDVDDFLAMIEPRFPEGTYRLGQIGAVIGTHGGPRLVGITYQVP